MGRACIVLLTTRITTTQHQSHDTTSIARHTLVSCLKQQSSESVCEFAMEYNTAYLHNRILYLLNEGPFIEGPLEVDIQRVESHRTLLMTACKHGFADHVSSLIELKANPDIQDRNGRTALHHAVLAKNSDIACELLMNTKVNVNIQDTDGNTALHCAVMSRDMEVITDLILGTLVDVNIRNHEGKTAMEYAWNCVEIFDLLFRAGTELDCRRPLPEDADPQVAEIIRAWNTKMHLLNWFAATRCVPREERVRMIIGAAEAI